MIGCKGLLLFVIFSIFTVSSILYLGSLLWVFVLLIFTDIVLLILLLHVDHLYVVLDVVAMNVDGSTALDQLKCYLRLVELHVGIDGARLSGL